MNGSKLRPKKRKTRVPWSVRQWKNENKNPTHIATAVIIIQRKFFFFFFQWLLWITYYNYRFLGCFYPSITIFIFHKQWFLPRLTWHNNNYFRKKEKKHKNSVNCNIIKLHCYTSHVYESLWNMFVSWSTLIVLCI